MGWLKKKQILCRAKDYSNFQLEILQMTIEAVAI
jgi:hypothetical protein